MKKIKRVIYRLWHNKSATGKVGYIGRDRYYPGRLNLETRAKEKECRKLYNALKKYPIKFWHKEILASGFRSDKSLSKAEMRFIKKFDSKNRGYNLTDGGEGCIGYKHTDEAKKRMSAFHTGKEISAETRRKISIANKGKKVSVETRKLMSLALIGNKYGISNKGNVGRKTPEETLKKMRKAQGGENNAMWGRHHSEETKKKIGDSHRGKYAGKGNPNWGKKHSRKTRKKISDALKLLYKQQREDGNR